MRGFLVAMQATLTVALAAGAFNMGSSFLKLLGTDLGFRTNRAVTLNVSLSGTRYQTEKREREYYREALGRLWAVPGVRSAAAVSYLPLMSHMLMGGFFKLDSGERTPLAALIAASPGYFGAMGTEVIQGRGFNDTDRDESERVAVISDELARSFGNKPLVGRKLDVALQGTPRMATIVGVVRAQRYAGPAWPGGGQIFLPLEQWIPGAVTIVAKVNGDPERYLTLVRDAVQQTDRDVPVYDVKTFDERLSDWLAQPRFYTTAILFFAGFSLLLAAIGAYGAAAYSVAQRVPELGVRIAVGATPGRVRAMLFREGMTPVCVGLLAGVFAAIELGGLLRHMIATAEPTGMGICAAAASVLTTAAAAAVLIATHRVLHMDPAAALRTE